MRAGFLSILSLCVLAVCLPAKGEDQPMSGAAEAQFIRDLLRDRRPPHLLAFITEDGTDLYRPREWVAWCEQFRADFGEQRGIEHVEPVVQSQRYDDPVFRPWQDRCPILAFNARSVHRSGQYPPGARGDWLRGLPSHMPDGSWLLDYQYGTRDFKLFQGDYDNDAYDDGYEEVIFFSDAFYSYWALIARDERFPLALPPLDRNWNDVMPGDALPADMFIDLAAEYRLLDLDKCLSSHLADVSSPYYSRGGGGTPYHGLIKYRDQYYMFEMGVGEGKAVGSYNLDLTAMKPHREATRGRPVDDIEGPPYCRFLPQ